jgi:hypothetical protein
MKKIALTLLLFAGLATVSTGCTPRMAGAMIGAAVVGAAIAHTVHVIHHYDIEYHRRHCAHTRRWHRGRWVYRCRGEWVYYDYRDQCWYGYR